MRGRISGIVVRLSGVTRRRLEHTVRRTTTPAGVARRARAVLLIAAGERYAHVARRVGMSERYVRMWVRRFLDRGIRGLYDKPRPGRPPTFSPVVALHVVKMACERPDEQGRSLCQWNCGELAWEMVAAGVVAGISRETVRRILASHQLKPWRHHLWLSSKVPRDAAFAQQVEAIADLYTRPLFPAEMVLCVDEKTSLQPRTRLCPTRPARPQRPMRVEHEYKRCGALNLFAAFDTRTGHVYATTAPRKRQVEFIAFLEQLDHQIPASVTTVHLVMDNLRMHTGAQVRAWLDQHPRFSCHFPPVHCSWMNQVEQWFSILQRKRLRVADFADLDHLAARLQAFVREWNERAHPFNWLRTSVAKVMARCAQEAVVKAA
jgi:transposase